MTLLPRLVLVFGLLAGLASAEVRVHLAGDSTMANKERTKSPNPEYGWGEVLPRYFKNPDAIVNHAANGRSAKSFIKEGRWQKLIAGVQPGDWVIVQFGHNDQKQGSPDRYAAPRGEFQELLRGFIREVRAKGAFPILAPSVARRKWNETQTALLQTHGDYPDATRELAEAEAVPLLELNRLTTELEEAHGVEGSKRLHLWIAPGVYERQPKGWKDDTHYSYYGADRVAALAVQEIIRLGLPLAQELKGDLPVADQQPDATAEK